MAQYYNLVTNASGALTFEEVPRICTVDGQQVQLVVENVNNGGNGSQQLVTYTATPQNRQAIFSPQTVNLGNQRAATRLEQGQNVFIIKTTDIATTQGILKSNTSNAHVNENIVSIVDTGTNNRTECKNEGQQIQWIKMQNANSATSAKQNTLSQEKNQTANSTRSNIQNNIISQPSICVNSGSFNSGQTEKKLFKSHQNKSRPLLNSVKVGVTSQTPDEINVITTMENRIQNSNVARSKSGMSVCKGVLSPEQNITIKPINNSPNTSNVRPVAIVPSEISKTPVRTSDIKYLSEQIRNAKVKQQQQLQKQHIEKPKFQQNNVQRQLPNALQQSVQPSLSNPARRSMPSNSMQQRVQRVSISPQKQQKSSIVTSRLPSTEHNTHVTSTNMKVDPSECAQEKGNRMQQSPSQLEQTSESVVYFQKTIHDPANTKVKHQVKGNTAKMLVITSREQRLIGFDIPNEDCTVQDLLDQVRAVLGEVSVSFCSKTIVSLVNDSSLNINYIVDVGTGTILSSFDNNDHGDCNSSQETVSSTTNTPSSPNINASDENSNTSLSTPEMFYKKNNERNAKLEKVERDGPTCKRPKGKGRASKPKPIHKEPECLTISSDDEEEEGKTKKIGFLNNSVVLGNASDALPEEMDTILDKEPVITNTSVFSSYNDYLANIEENSKGKCDNKSFVDNEQLQLTQIAIECRTVRIGSYKYYPREKVAITHNGIRFSVPLLEDVTSFVTLDVKYQDIIKLLIHYGKGMPVLFFYTSIKTGAMIRELLGMQDPKGPYYDPAGKDQTHKRITLLPEKLPDDSRATLKLLFARGDKIEELNPKEANDILIRASPRDNQQSQEIVKKQVPGSVPNSAGATECIQTITVYPPPPAKGGIAINTEDYLCLAEDQFLNDVIIDFYLKYLTLEVLSESDQQRTHVFSSYFYKRLTSPQPAENNVPMTPAAKRHARVQKWTKNVNIFEKDFIIIPINEHAHWFLAIICFPGLVGKISTCVATKTNENDADKAVQKSKKLKELKTKAVTIGSTTITPVPTTITIDQLDDGSERDEAEGDDEEMEMEYSEEEEEEDDEPKENKSQAQIKVEPQKETVRIPCILIFDSLAGASRARVVATLRDYLSCEYVAKLGEEKTFSKDTIKGACPKVPQQSNFTDCGLYLLQYVESFFQDPIIDYTLPIKTLKTWFEEIVVTRKREELSQLLTKLMNNTKGDKTINLPTVNFPTQDGKLKPKSENNTDAKTAKPEAENKKKSSTNVETETRIVSIVTENTEQNNEFVNTYQFISISSNATENSSTEMLAEQKPTRSSSDTMSYLKAKRIPRLMSRTQNQDDSQNAKRHKGESYNSCK